jgi:hypothetical protein
VTAERVELTTHRVLGDIRVETFHLRFPRFRREKHRKATTSIAEFPGYPLPTKDTADNRLLGLNATSTRAAEGKGTCERLGMQTPALESAHGQSRQRRSQAVGKQHQDVFEVLLHRLTVIPRHHWITMRYTMSFCDALDAVLYARRQADSPDSPRRAREAGDLGLIDSDAIERSEFDAIPRCGPGSSSSCDRSHCAAVLASSMNGRSIG